MNNSQQKDGYPEAARLMCQSLSQFETELPELGRIALRTATEFWSRGIGSQETLISLRLDCWDYLRAKGRNTDILDREDTALRALLCVLYPEPQPKGFLSETWEWFDEWLGILRR